MKLFITRLKLAGIYVGLPLLAIGFVVGAWYLFLSMAASIFNTCGG